MQVGRRPAVVLGSFPAFQVVTVVPGTAAVAAANRPYVVLVQPTRENGLSMATMFLGFQVQTVNKSIVRRPPIGRLSNHDLACVEDAVRGALGL